MFEKSIIDLLRRYSIVPEFMSKLLVLISLLLMVSAGQSRADCLEAYSNYKTCGLKRHERNQILNLLDDTKGDYIAAVRFGTDSLQRGISGSQSELQDLVYGAYDQLPNKDSFKIIAVARLSASYVRNANESNLLCPAGKKAMTYKEILQYAIGETVKKLSNLKD